MIIFIILWAMACILMFFRELYRGAMELTPLLTSISPLQGMRRVFRWKYLLRAPIMGILLPNLLMGSEPDIPPKKQYKKIVLQTQKLRDIFEANTVYVTTRDSNITVYTIKDNTLCKHNRYDSVIRLAIQERNYLATIEFEKLWDQSTWIETSKAKFLENLSPQYRGYISRIWEYEDTENHLWVCHQLLRKLAPSTGCRKEIRTIMNLEYRRLALL